MDRKIFKAWSNLKRRPTDPELAEWDYRLNERLGIMGYSHGDKINPQDLALAIQEADRTMEDLSDQGPLPS